ncbi:lysophospholipid acyltransferase 7 [Lingula anatina]|uniref:Lysophospholipid acyltransferase 7 n=1 Tax=Lingula anatina TaxID=7574 RepID=A0A1S3IQ26_LINAN|nr:lysophospholipid acyltransferase 7 [Lingula anatina]|eukprot:XP_013400325.1 lysophospholipid acyltransferase 7 [Lingula anatina]
MFGLTADDFIYATLLIISVFCGTFIKQTKDARHKQLLSSTIGAGMVLVVCGFHLLHSFITALVNALLVLWISPRYCHIVSFMWCFGYLTFFRTTHYFGLPKVPSHSNAVQLLLTLKMVGLAFELHDSYKRQQKAKSAEDCQQDAQRQNLALEAEYRNINPSLMDIMLYSYCYIGLLTGPYFKYRTYHDMLHNEHTASIPTWQPLLEKLKVLPVCALLFIVTSMVYPLEYVKTEEFHQRFFLYRLWYMIVTFFIFRMRIYSAWILSEMVCITSALGAYPKDSRPKRGQGPTNLGTLKDLETSADEVEYDFETIHNISPSGCEMSSTVREGMKSWNMSVQFWLAHFVYSRVPFRSIRTFLTMLVSAYWHGIHPGYYLSFLLVPFVLMAEDAMIKAFRDNASNKQQQIFDWFWWFFKLRFLEYMSMGFLLLGLYSTLDYWSSIYFFGHVMTAVFYVTGLVFMKRKSSGKKME